MKFGFKKGQYGNPEPKVRPVHTAPFLYKNGEINLGFYESVHIDLHKNATKTEVFETAVESGYPQKRTIWKRSESMWTHKNGGF